MDELVVDRGLDVINDELRHDAGVDATEYDGERMLSRGHFPPDGERLVRVSLVVGAPAPVAHVQLA
ncbi:hypothetical protein ACIBG6_04910 [Streptomyces sp. NPDC050842]|uniref:hypothetical protein n=1 Tax=Streptomyces sp. NPDC050842 TaxID=3365636 RepID=UPI003798BA5B